MIEKNLSDYIRRKTNSGKDIQRRKLFYQIGEQVFEALGGDQDGHQ
ncbi:hypothetical protein I8F96_09840 [Enterococcus casseliflavus]|nr:hypothetical protein [Enterococcus casseliflavus]